jgi:DNA polymerase III subunit gamma/tau
MSYLVLARKYRPQTFGEVVGQAHVTTTLTNAISAGRVAHAIIFSGPRGTGKTTVARILAKAMNCKHGSTSIPCNECRSCRDITSGSATDVFEIDGASNNSVDQVRELRENIKYMPAHSRYKIYIIDEVHMLTIAAFNALLKTLEEPPAHAMFIFATTEPHKIPITILSRCQRHDFKRMGMDTISKHLSMLCTREGFETDVDSLDLIARKAEGSMRDALSLLDQVMACSSGSIPREQVLDLLGVVDRRSVFDISGAFLGQDLTTILTVLDDIYSRGHDFKRFYSDLIEHFRNLLVVRMGKEIDRLVDLPPLEIEKIKEQTKNVSLFLLHQVFDTLFNEEMTVRHSARPRLVIETIFIRLLSMKPVLAIDTLIDNIENLRHEIPDAEPGICETVTGFGSSDSSMADQKPAGLKTGAESGVGSGSEICSGIQTESSVDPVEISQSASEMDDLQQRFFELVMKNSPPSFAPIFGKCKLARTSDSEWEIVVEGTGFDVTRLNKNMTVINDAGQSVFGKGTTITVTAGQISNIDQKAKKDSENRQRKETLNHPLVADAVEIFNGKVVDVKIL